MYLMELWITYGVLTGIAIGISSTAAVDMILRELSDRKQRTAAEIQLYGRKLTRKERKWLSQRQRLRQMGVAAAPFPSYGPAYNEPRDARAPSYHIVESPATVNVPAAPGSSDRPSK
ncbi:hypothetical protein Dda_1060 [Drechslerella dactyloides]|uniref:Uncharacterized protein n=1 Tax=Drechslerella dactyloides TaxID=74499 RepID=A0AAD6NNL4_DREDA|nr:hypothetical protein Dda_1060 [Drechslerella dactyloides]